MLAFPFKKTLDFSLKCLVLLTVFPGLKGNVTPVTQLGDPCTKASDCEEMVADSTCIFNTCSCKKGYEHIGNNFCDLSSSDAEKYNVPSRKPILLCNKLNGCDFPQQTCKTKFVRRLLGIRDSMKTTPGSVMSGFCGLNIKLNFSKTDKTKEEDMHTVNTLCYVYESPYGSFRVAEIKVKEPPRSYPGSVTSHVTCTAGKDNCHQYRFSGFVVGFFAGIPPECFRDLPSSSFTICPEILLIFLSALLLLFRSLQLHV